VALFLTFKLGGDRYALEATRVVEVLPLVGLTKVFRAPPGIAGTLNYHAAFVPVIDISELMLGRSAEPRLSTRIIIVRIAAADRESRLLGIIAENATETMRCSKHSFVAPGIVSDEAPFLGPISVSDRGNVQRIDVDRLLPASARDFVFEPSTAQ